MAGCLYCVVDGTFSAIPRLDLVLVPRMAPPCSCYPYKHQRRPNLHISCPFRALATARRDVQCTLSRLKTLVLTLFVVNFIFYLFKTSLLHFPLNGMCNVADNCNVCLLHILAAKCKPLPYVAFIKMIEIGWDSSSNVGLRAA